MKMNPNEDNSSSYFMNASDARELARLMTQGTMITHAMGGGLPEQSKSAIAHIHTVLDVACGPGGWALSLAERYPHMQIMGIDVSVRMIEYAQAQVRARRLTNVTFRVMDAKAAWAIADHPFDLINGRLLISFLAKADWPPFLQECIRHLRSGGILRLTEAENGMTNMPACERLNQMICQAFYRAGQSFSPDGQRFGITLVLKRLLQEVGLVSVQSRAHAIDGSHGAEAYESFRDNILFGYPLVKPFLIRHELVSEQEFEQEFEAAQVEVGNPDFRALMFLLTVWGTKP